LRYCALQTPLHAHQLTQSKPNKQKKKKHVLPIGLQTFSERINLKKEVTPISQLTKYRRQEQQQKGRFKTVFCSATIEKYIK
jgi:beta-xylosidase